MRYEVIRDEEFAVALDITVTIIFYEGEISWLENVWLLPHRNPWSTVDTKGKLMK